MPCVPVVLLYLYIGPPVRFGIEWCNTQAAEMINFVFVSSKRLIRGSFWFLNVLANLTSVAI